MSASDYESVVCRWAAGKLGVTVEQIESVKIDAEDGTPGWSTWTPGEPGYSKVVAHLTADVPEPRVRIVMNLEDANGWPFSQLLAEILAVGGDE